VQFREDFGEDLAIDVAAGQDDGYASTCDGGFFPARSGKRDCTGSLCDIMRVGEKDAHRGADVALVDSDDAGHMGEDQLQCVLVRGTHGDAFGRS